MNLSEVIGWSPDADEAEVWAAIREWELRTTRYERAKLGLAGAIAKMIPAVRSVTEALVGLDRAYAGQR
jgi:hypothetical protein